MKKILLIALLSITIAKPAFSQKNLLDFWKAEKIKFSDEQLQQIKEGKLKIQDLKLKGESDNLLADDDNMSVTSGTNPESEITAAINPTNSDNMVVSAIRQSSGGLECPIYYTTDFGATWAASSFMFSSSLSGTIIGGGDPVLCFDADGKLYFSWITLFLKSGFDSLVSEMRWASSTDGGKTFDYGEDSFIGRASARFTGSASNLPFFLDKQWMVCDKSNSSNRGNLYVSLTNLNSGIGDAGDFSNTGIYVGVKKAGENKFNRKLIQATPTEFTNIQFSSIDCDSQGRIYVSFWAYIQNTHSLWSVYSDDGFETVSTPVKISNFKFNAGKLLPSDGTEQPIPGIPERTYPYPSIRVDKSGGEYDGNVYVTWCAVGLTSILNNGMDVYFSRSTDRGVSWSEPQSLNFNEVGKYTHQFYPTLAVNDKGAIAVTYYNNSKPNAGDNTDYVTSVSFDGGLTFGNSKILSDAQTNFASVGLVNGNFGIGEYNGLVMTNDYIIPFWSDGRSDNGHLKIYTTHCSISAIPPIDGVELELSPINGDITNLSADVVNGILNLKFNSVITANSSFIISDLNGNKIAENNFSSFEGVNDLSFPLPTVSTGVYFISFNFGGEYLVKKFIAKRI